MSADQIDNLAQSILYHKRKYYDGEPEISDAEYDALEDRLRQLDPRNPVLFIVGTPAGGKVAHDPPMLSSDKALNPPDDVIKWAQKMDGNTLIAGYKVDGLSLSLVFENNTLIQAATRGNGQFGDDVTLAVMNIDDIPKRIPVSGRVNVRGEIYMRISEFNKINQDLDDSLSFASPRNLAAGTIKQKDVRLVKSRKLNFKAFDLIFEESKQNLSETIKLLETWGFDTADKTIIENWSPEKLEATFNEFQNERDELDFEIDGVVFKYNTYQDRMNAGQTEHHPKWQIAWKFKSRGDVTKIVGITWQVGRTSVLTPVAELEPVVLSGATIKRATMHNADFVQNMNINVGDTVSVTRSGDVIPKIIGVEEKLGNDFEFPEFCPSCGNPTKREGVSLICTGIKCRERDLQSIIHWINMTEIENVGPKSVEKLYDSDLITDFADLYRKELNRDLLVELFGKNGEKMYSSLKDGRQLELHKLLAGLGIPILGKKLGKTLSDHFRTLEKIENATEDDLIQLEGISNISAQSIVSGIKNNPHIQKLQNYGVEIVYKANKTKSTTPQKTGLAAFWDDFGEPEPVIPQKRQNRGQKLYVTGSVDGMTKKDIEAKVEELGFEWSSSISKNLSMLVYGKNAGQAKLDKASQLGIEILTWEEFLKKYT